MIRRGLNLDLNLDSDSAVEVQPNQYCKGFILVVTKFT